MTGVPEWFGDWLFLAVVWVVGDSLHDFLVWRRRRLDAQDRQTADDVAFFRSITTGTA